MIYKGSEEKVPYYLYSFENQSFGILHHNKDLKKYDKSF